MSYTKVTASFTPKFGFRSIKTLLTRLNQGIVLRKADDLRFAIGNQFGAQRYLGKTLDLAEINLEYVRISDAASLNKTSYDTALECWIKLGNNDSYNVPILVRWSSATGEKLEINSSGQIVYTIGDGTDSYIVVSATDLRDGDWHHIFAYADRSTEAYIFVDGVDNTDTRTGIITDVNSIDVSDYFYIGKNGSAYSTIQVDEVRSWLWTGGIPADINNAIIDHFKCPYALSDRFSDTDLALWLKFHDVSGTTFTDETTNSNDGTAYASGATINVSNLQTDNILRSSYAYQNEVLHAGTRAFRLKCFWDADDDAEHTLYYWFYDANNYIKLYKNTANSLIFKVVANGTEKTATIDVSILFDTGDWFSIVAVWNFNTTIDGTNYLKLYVNSANTGVSTTTVNDFENVGSLFRLGYDGSSIIDAIIAMQVDNMPWYDTIANAEAAGFGRDKSIEYWYNSGSFNLPVVDEFTKVCLADELSGDDKPQILNAVFRVLLSEDTETTDSSTHKKAKVTGTAGQFYAGQRLLVGVPLTYSQSSWANWFETALVDTVTDNGDGTITLTFTAAFNASIRANYTTANATFITNNLVFDGNMEEFGIAAWGESNVATLKDGQTVFNGRQSVRIRATTASGYLYSRNISVVAGENYLLSVVAKVDSGNGLGINVYDVTNSAVIKLSNTLENTAFNLYQMSFEIPSGCTEIRIDFIVRDDTESVNIGDVVLLQNLIDNGGFEGTYVSSLAPGWTKTGSPTLQQEITQIHGGDKAQGVIGNSGSYLSQTITIQSGRWYTLSGWLKTTTGTVKLTGATTKTLTSAYDTSYRRIGYTFKALTGSLVVQIYAAGGGGTQYFFDDFALIQLNIVEANTSTPSVAANCYSIDKWGNANRAFCVHGGAILKYAASGVLNTGLGTIVALFKAPFDYDDIESDFYLFEIEEVFRIWYDVSENKFKFDVYNGSSWLSTESVAQTFSAGDWLYISGLFNNQSGLTIYVNTIQGTEVSTTWDEQPLPTYLFIMSDHNGENQPDAVFDYPHGYDEYLTATQIAEIVNGNWGDK